MNQFLTLIFVVSTIYLIYSFIASLVKGKKDKKGYALIGNAQKEEAPLPSPCEVTITRDYSLNGMLNDYQISLNNTVIGKLSNNSSLSASTTYRKNIVSSPSCGKSLVFETQGDEPVQLKFNNSMKGLNISIISGATEVSLSTLKNKSNS